MIDDLRNKQIVVFDGLCNLCNRSVQFILKHDIKKAFLFANNQSEVLKSISKELNFDLTNNQSIVYLRKGKIYTQSTASLLIAYDLGGWLKPIIILWIIPNFIRNLAYKTVAKNRYKWFGKRETCMIPTPALANRFI
jgi:predicted DCC family thiol-disulfide oxidoreductase YuxK